MYSPARALFMLRTAQNLPHMEQVSLWSSSGRRASRMAFAVSGVEGAGELRIPVEDAAGIAHLVVDVPGVGDALCDVSGVGGDLRSHDALLDVVHIGQSQMLGGGDVAQERLRRSWPRQRRRWQR